MFEETKILVEQIAQKEGISLRVYPRPIELPALSSLLFPVKGERVFYLGAWSEKADHFLQHPQFFQFKPDKNKYFSLYPFDFANYQLLSQHLPRLRPAPARVRSSVGSGDRLGLVSATHLEVFRNYPFFPIIAQQSPRELEKTHRTFEEVLLSAAWGVLESGFEGQFGADADHIKDENYLRAGIKSHFTMFTLDGSEVIRPEGFSLTANQLKAEFDRLSPSQKEIFNRYQGKELHLGGGITLNFKPETLLPIVIALFGVIEWVEQMNSILNDELSDFDLEVSLDETEVITSPEAHFLVAEELHRRGIDFQSLAPRFPGKFEKGVDYQGDLSELTQELKAQVAVQQEIEGYRLSLHSGSDKWTVYPLFAELTGGLFHLKTSGTNWLAALSVLAKLSPSLFRRAYQIGMDHLEESLQAYSISFDREELPLDLSSTPDDRLPELMDKRAPRQMLHISYGPILEEMGKELYQFWFEAEKEHYQKVGDNLKRHLELLTQVAP